MAARPSLPLLLAAVALAAGCAPFATSRPWDSDAPVLPLRGEVRAEGDPLPDSYIVLLEGEDGTTGSIVFESPEGRAVLGEPGLLSLDTMAVSRTHAALADELNRTFAEALSFEPRAPLGIELYYPSDEVEPTSESRQQLEEVATALGDWPAAEVRLDGHADRFGTNEHNLELSRRRAEAVRDVLVAAGARADLVEVTWHGESRNAVPTADGVREPRNRRVEIRVR